MTLRNPGIALRALVLAAQGVFYNIFCTFSPLLLYKFKGSRSNSNQSCRILFLQELATVSSATSKKRPW
jgi:hypothetical protein